MITPLYIFGDLLYSSEASSQGPGKLILELMTDLTDHLSRPCERYLSLLADSWFNPCDNLLCSQSNAANLQQNGLYEADG